MYVGGFLSWVLFVVLLFIAYLSKHILKPGFKKNAIQIKLSSLLLLFVTSVLVVTVIKCTNNAEIY